MGFNEQLKFGQQVEDFILPEFFEKKGVEGYKAIGNYAHQVDGIIRFKNKTYGVDVKAKESLRKYPLTSINKTHYNVYTNNFEDVYLIFVDGYKQLIYGNWISKLKPVNLEKSFFHGKELTTFSLNEMEIFRELTQGEVSFLNQNSHINPLYLNL